MVEAPHNYNIYLEKHLHTMQSKQSSTKPKTKESDNSFATTTKDSKKHEAIRVDFKLAQCIGM